MTRTEVRTPNGSLAAVRHPAPLTAAVGRAKVAIAGTLVAARVRATSPSPVRNAQPRVALENATTTPDTGQRMRVPRASTRAHDDELRVNTIPFDFLRERLQGRWHHEGIMRASLLVPIISPTPHVLTKPSLNATLGDRVHSTSQQYYGEVYLPLDQNSDSSAAFDGEIRPKSRRENDRTEQNLGGQCTVYSSQCLPLQHETFPSCNPSIETTPAPGKACRSLDSGTAEPHSNAPNKTAFVPWVDSCIPEHGTLSPEPATATRSCRSLPRHRHRHHWHRRFRCHHYHSSPVRGKPKAESPGENRGEERNRARTRPKEILRNQVIIRARG